MTILKSKLIGIILTFISLSMLVSCGLPSASNVESTGGVSTTVESTSSVALGRLPSNTPDFFYLNCSNCDVIIYSTMTMGRFLRFQLISGQPLTKEDITLILDINTPHSYTLSEQEIKQFPYNVYQSYQNVNWKKMSELAQAAFLTQDDDKPLSEEGKAYQQFRDQYLESYSALTSEQIPQLYFYFLTISFQMTEDTQDEIIDKLNINVKGIDYTYNLKRVYIDNSTPTIATTERIKRRVYASIDVPAYPSKNGKLQLPVMEYTAEEATTLNDIRFFDDLDTVFDEISAKITYANGISVDILWDGKSSIDLSKGDVIKLNITCHDPSMANTLYYTTIKYLILEYMCGDQTYRTSTEISFRMRQSAYEIYAAQCDGVDILSYYLDYYNSMIEGNAFAEK